MTPIFILQSQTGFTNSRDVSFAGVFFNTRVQKGYSRLSKCSGGELFGDPSQVSTRRLAKTLQNNELVRLTLNLHL